MRWLFYGLIILSFMLGCATTSPDLLPPNEEILPPAFNIETPHDRKSMDYFLLKMADTSSEPRVRWWVEYKRAQLWAEEDPLLACSKWAALSQEPRFPLKTLSLLRAHQTCARVNQPPALAPIPVQVGETWLRGPQLEANLAAATANGDKTQQFSLLIEKSKLPLDPEDKLKFVLFALDVAEDLNAPELTATALERREKIAPRFLREPKPGDWLPMAIDYRRAREFASARKYYGMALSRTRVSDQLKLRALKGLAQTFKTEHNKTKYIETLKKLVAFTEPKVKKGKKARRANWKGHYDAVIALARAEWTAGQASRARKLLRQKIPLFNKQVRRAELFWILGRMEEETKEYASAVDWFLKAEKELPQDAVFREKIYWYLGWNLRKLARWEEAITTLTRGRDESTNDFSRLRFQYWLAATYQTSGLDAEKGQALLDQVIQEDPLGYYGLLALRDRHLPIRKLNLTDQTPQQSSRLRDLLDWTSLEWLVSVEESDLAQELLDRGFDQLMRQKAAGQDDATLTDLLRAYARAGSYQRLYERLGRIPPDQRQNLLAHHPELLFPQPWRPQVKAAAERFGLPSELLFAIMRQESSFNPRARSPADAFGLMQLLPEVASSVAPAVQVQYQRAEDLFTPEINIPLGAYHLRQLWDRFHGQFILAVASYNASEKSIRQWVKLRFAGDPIAFIEEIPYEETRGYIRLVLRNMIFYQLLNSPTGEIEFPEWVFQLKSESES